ISKSVNLDVRAIANWRAGCGKSASPVRREGERKPMRSPYPYRKTPFPACPCMSPCSSNL
ncbi:MAG: hypothetical protein WAX69_23770, partial [Victivallales bacterium]